MHFQCTPWCSVIFLDISHNLPHLGKPYSNEMFLPIGNYILLENGSSSFLDPVSVSTQVQELVLKEPFRHVKSLNEIKDGHKIASYSKNLTSPSPSPGPAMVLKSCFELRIEGTASIVWTETKDKMWRCQLAVKGRFFRTLQMSSAANDFSGMPFKSSSSVIYVWNQFFYIYI